MEGTLDRIEFLDARQFQIVMRRLADSLSYGTDRSAFLGSGVEYAQLHGRLQVEPLRPSGMRDLARIVGA